MDRRTFVTTMAGAALAAPLATGAQPAGKVYRVGFLWDSPGVFPDAIEAFRHGLRDLGYVEGRNIVIEYRWAEGKPDRMRELAEELVRLKVDVIMAPSSVYTGAVRRATSTIPIVFVVHADPIGSGHVASLARPGGNITGLSIMMTETNVKGLELFKQAVPGLSHVAVIWDPATPSHRPGLKAVEDAGPSLGLRIQSAPVRSAAEYEGAFSAMVRERADGVLVLSTPLFIAGAKRLAELALTHRLPSLFGPKHHVAAGGLLSYGPDRADQFRRAALYVDKILKGAKPADLPVQQPTKFELAINLKTAKTLGLIVPQSLLARADGAIVKSCGLSEIRRRPSSAPATARHARHQRTERRLAPAG
jgi:putative ABC transport system substrate-binding protein